MPQCHCPALQHHTISPHCPAAGSFLQALRYLERALKIFSIEEQKNMDIVLKVLEQICKAANGVEQEEKILYNADQMWKIMERYSQENAYYIELILKYTLQCLTSSLSYAKKNYLFKILLYFQANQSEYKIKERAEPKKEIYLIEKKKQRKQLEQEMLINEAVNKQDDSKQKQIFLGRISEQEKRKRKELRRKFLEQYQYQRVVSDDSDKKSDQEDNKLNENLERLQKKPTDADKKDENNQGEDNKELPRKTTRFMDEEDLKQAKVEKSNLQTVVRFQIEKNKEHNYTGPAEADRKKHLIEDIVELFREYKNCIALVKHILFVFLGKFDQFTNNHNFFIDFKLILEQSKGRQDTADDPFLEYAASSPPAPHRLHASSPPAPRQLHNCSEHPGATAVPSPIL